MRRHGIGPLLLVGATGCTPAIEPPWVVARARELAMRVEVIAQGPYGATLSPEALSVNEALPLDTVRAHPLVVGPSGEIPLGELSPTWYVCDDSGNCLLRADPTTLPTCDFENLVPDDPCTAPGGDVLDLTLGDFFATDEPDAIFALNRAPTIGFVASTAEGPGTPACLQGIGDRTSLQDCLWIERTLGLGSLGEVVDGLTALGYDVEVSESLAPLLGVPRNHNPSVREFSVSIDGEPPVSYEPEATVTVATDSTVVVTYEPAEDDIDRYTVEIDGAAVDVEDRLEGRWFASREVAVFDEVPGSTSVSWTATAADPVTLYFVVRDDRRAEAWGWLHFEPQ